MKSCNAGCENCGSVRFAPIRIFDNGDLSLECAVCGAKIFVGEHGSYPEAKKDRRNASSEFTPLTLEKA